MVVSTADSTLCRARPRLTQLPAGALGARHPSSIRRLPAHVPPLAADHGHGQRRLQGVARPDPRLRRSREPAGPRARGRPTSSRPPTIGRRRPWWRSWAGRGRAFGFLLEEGGAIAGDDTSNRWIVDPLDGTTNFLHGLPHFAISIGLERDGKPYAGVIHDPVRDETFWGGERRRGVPEQPAAARLRPAHAGAGAAGDGAALRRAGALSGPSRHGEPPRRGDRGRAPDGPRPRSTSPTSRLDGSTGTGDSPWSPGTARPGSSSRARPAAS